MKLHPAIQICFVILLAFIVNSFFYFSFANIYSAPLFNYEKFVGQYSNGVYQYRFLSTDLLLSIYDFLEKHSLFQSFKITFIDGTAEKNMFLAYYFLNTFFLCATAVVMLLMLEHPYFSVSHSEKILLVTVGIFTIGLSQFVLVPYDCSSYFFLIVFFWGLLNYVRQPSTFKLVGLALIVLISTFNRETSALSISLAAVLLYSVFGLTKRTLTAIVVLVAVFLSVYIGVRIAFGTFTTNDGNLLVYIFTNRNNFPGLLFWSVFFVFSLLIAKGKQQQQFILLFHVLSLPYIAMCLYSGIMYEIRLYVPLFLTSLFLSQIKLNAHQTNDSRKLD